MIYDFISNVVVDKVSTIKETNVEENHYFIDNIKSCFRTPRQKNIDKINDAIIDMKRSISNTESALRMLENDRRKYTDGRGIIFLNKKKEHTTNNLLYLQEELANLEKIKSRLERR